MQYFSPSGEIYEQKSFEGNFTHSFVASPAGLSMAVVRLSALGDVALLSGVLLYWHQVRGLRFMVITRAGFAPLFFHHPAVLGICGLEAADLRGAGLWRALRGLTQHIPRGTTLLDLHGNVRTRLLGLLWPGKVLRYPKFGVARRLFLFSKGRFCRGKLRSLNVPQRYALALEKKAPARELLRPHFFMSAPESEAAQQALAALRKPGLPLIALHPYATHASKMWPLEYWNELCGLMKAAGWPFIVVGQSPQKKSVPQVPSAEMPAPECQEPELHVPDAQNFTNKTSLRELCALLAQASALVTGDSGPMHMAACPVVALFGPTTEEWGFFPQGERDICLQSDLSCRPCALHGGAVCAKGRACMRQLSPAQVFEALQKLL